MTAGNVFALIVWSNAAPHRGAILEELTQRFTLLAVVDVRWSHEQFASNLARLYGDRLPSAAEKAERCGTGPFTLVLVGDERPVYRLRRTRRRLERVNRNVFAARERCRRMTKSHDLVHATLDDAEAERDVFLITGRERASFAAVTPLGEAMSLQADLLGTFGWSDRAQLLRALELVGGCRERDERWTLAVGDSWWAARLAFVSDDPPMSGPVSVAGARVELRLLPDASPASWPARLRFWR